MSASFPVPRNSHVCVGDGRGGKHQLGFIECPRCRLDLFVYMDGPLPAGCCFCGMGFQPVSGPANAPIAFSVEAMERASLGAAK